MIVLHPTLSVDDLAEFTDFDSIRNRPMYIKDVDPAKVQLVKPIGIYRFRDKILCGLKTCHTPHGKGLVVVTSEGTEVNIGHICGRRHFGEQFAVFIQHANRMETRKVHITKIRELKAVAGRHSAHITAIIEAPKDAAWCSRAVRKFKSSLPWDAVESLMEMAKRGDSKVYEEVEVEGEHANILRELGVRGSFGGRSKEDTHINRKYMGRLAGLPVLLTDPGKLLFDLQTELADFLKVDPINCKPKEVRQAADFAAQFEYRLKAAEGLIADGARFFTQKNFALLPYLAKIKHSSKQSVESLDWDFDAGTLRTTRAA